MGTPKLVAGLVVPLALALLPGPASAAPADRLPHELPAPAARAAGAGAGGWLVGARASRAADRTARAHGARATGIPGAWRVPAGRARALAAALRAAGTLRWSEADVRLVRQSQVEGQDGAWARGAVVAPGLAPPRPGAAVGIVDDLVDTATPDTAAARLLNAGQANVAGPHGTEVASVAAGAANGTGVIGVLPGAPLISYGLVRSTCSEVADGVTALARAGAKVVNVSLGSTERCFLLQLAIDGAYGRGTLVVASAGNEFERGDPIVYPAAYPHVMSVGALDEALNPAFFSSTGAALDVAAPGVSVPVARPVAFDHDGTPDGLGTGDGTSFSAPMVAGAAAWVMAARPALAVGQVADVLRGSARDLAAPGWDRDTGYGLVDVAAALAAPEPPLDPAEPNDGITLVNGTALDKPDPYVYTGRRKVTFTASVDPVEDPVDVYRVRLPAGGRLVARLRPSSGNADLAVYDGEADGLQDPPADSSRRGAGRTDVVRVRNAAIRPRTAYVAVTAPSLRARTFDAPYRLSLGRS